jgi:hypothetical protein
MLDQALADALGVEPDLRGPGDKDVYESFTKSYKRRFDAQQRGKQLDPNATEEQQVATGQAAGDEGIEDFFKRKSNPEFGANGEMKGDPNRTNPITPATGAAQRPGNPNSVSKTRDMLKWAKSTIRRKGAEAIYGDARSRTNAVGAGGSVNSWSNNGPYDYPDRKVDGSLMLLGAWRTKAGGNNTLWTSMLNSRGQMSKKNRFYKWSERKQNWEPVQEGQGVSNRMQKSSRNDMYGVPTGTRFSAMVKAIRMQKEKDIRLGRRGGELMEKRKSSTTNMEWDGFHTQK